MAISAAITFIISTSYSLNIYNDLVADVQQRAEMYTKLEQIDTYVRAYYDGDIDEDALIEALAEGYISVLGRDESQYLDETEYAIYKEHLSGTHLGIGVYCTESGGYLSVTSVLANSPASIAGIEVGESIVAINGDSVLDLGYDRAYAILRSDPGTPLALTIRSAGVDRRANCTTTQMTVPSVLARQIGEQGYIKIYEFNDKSYQQFTAAYSMLTTSGIKGLVIDLRNNEGLSFDSAINILSAYLPVDSVAALTTDLQGEVSVLERAIGANVITVPVTILTNANTAGPAELFAAAMRDSLGAQIVGASTRGEGTYTENYPLYDGACIILPISSLQSSDTQFDKVGVKPSYDVAVEGDTNSYLATLDENTDPCLKKALELLVQNAG